MNKTRSIKRSLIASIVVLCLLMTSLIGTTFAWFTDEVTSSGNKIVSGTLKVDLEILDKNSGNWTSLKESREPIFNYGNWEPGYTDVKILKVENEGTLALKWRARFVSANELSELAEVIDVYVRPSADAPTFPTSRDLEKEGFTYVGTLDQFVNTIEQTTYGSLLAKESAYLSIALRMQESAGNKYQQMDLGGAFDIQIVATQLASEEDSFGSDYDKNAWVEGLKIYNEEQLTAALYNGGNLALAADIEVAAPIYVPEGTTATLDLNGFNLSANNTTYAINNHGDLTIYDSMAPGASSTYTVARNNTAGSITARGIYNGYDPDGNNNPNAKLTIINGIYNATGENGGACVFNYGEAIIKSGTFTSVGGYSLNSRAGAKMTIETATVTGGIYNEGDLTIEDGEIATNRGGYTHAVYHAGTNLVINGGNFSGNGNEVIQANSSPAVINGGTFTKVEKTSYLIGGSQLVINDGYFFAHESNPAGHPVRPDVKINGGTFNYQPSNIDTSNGYVVNDNGDGTFSVGFPRVSTDDGLTAVLNEGGKVELDGQFTVENFNSGLRGETTIVGGTLSRDSGNGNPLTVYTTEKVVFEDVEFVSQKGGAVLATRKDGSNIEINNSVFNNLGAPSTGNTGIQVYAKDVTMTFNNCEFNNMPIVTSSSYVGTVKLVFNNCKFTWTGSNCPGMIQLANNVTSIIELNDCEFAYSAPDSTRGSKFINTTPSVAEGSSVTFNNFTMTGTAQEGKIWSVVVKGGVKTGENLVVTATGTNSYTFNGETIDFDTYLFR